MNTTKEASFLFSFLKAPSTYSYRLDRVPEDEWIEDYYEDYVSEDDVEDYSTKPVPIWLSVCLVVAYIIGGAFIFQVGFYIAFFFFWYPPFSGIAPCVGTTEVVQTPRLDSALLFAALGLALIWVERQVVRMMLFLCERERLIVLTAKV